MRPEGWCPVQGLPEVTGMAHTNGREIVAKREPANQSDTSDILVWGGMCFYGLLMEREILGALRWGFYSLTVFNMF